jgi:hypothetical protein
MKTMKGMKGMKKMKNNLGMRQFENLKMKEENEDNEGVI